MPDTHDADTGDADTGDADDKQAPDAFKGVFREDGGLDTDVVGRRLPTLVELLRHQEACFDLRIDFDTLSHALVSTAGTGLRDAADDEELEAALRDFSIHHLHELISDEDAEAACAVLQALTEDTSVSRKRRQAAAAGVGLASGLPDDRGLRGRGLFDLLLRISLEELHAQEDLKRRADADGGLNAKDLEQFWGKYPALKHHYEQRYRKDVQALLQAIDDDVLPHVISVDLAVRGTHALLSAVAVSTAAGEELATDRAAEILRDTFEDDMLDGGRELAIARWSAAAAEARAAGALGETSSEPGSDADAARITLIGTCDRATRIAAPGSPGGEMVLFHAYMRAVVEGSFHVQDAPEAAAARAAFGESGLLPEGVLGYAKHLAARGDPDEALHVAVAGIEIWPDDEGLRSLGTVLAEAHEGTARGKSHGPTYGERGETVAEDGLAPDATDGDDNDDSDDELDDDELAAANADLSK